MAAAAAVPSAASSAPLFTLNSPKHNAPIPPNLTRKPTNLSLPFRRRGSLGVFHASVAVTDSGLQTGPDDLVSSILSKVMETDGGVSLTREEHEEVARVARELQKYCVGEPVNNPLIFGEWDVVYCSRPTSPGGGYRSALGRVFFRTKEMIQAVQAPDIVRNKVAFSALGFLDGEVSLEGKLKALDNEWIQVIFDPPLLKVGGVEFRYGKESKVKLQITYIDEKIRLGIGSRGSLFVFLRRP